MPYEHRAFSQYFAYRLQERQIRQLKSDLNQSNELNKFIVNVDQSIKKYSKEEILFRINVLSNGGLKTKFNSIEIQMFKQEYINRCIETNDTKSLHDNKELMCQSNGYYRDIRPVRMLKRIDYWCIKGKHKATKSVEAKQLVADLNVEHNNLIVDPEFIANSEVGKKKNSCL